jgi:hypothetical protein
MVGNVLLDLAIHVRFWYWFLLVLWLKIIMAVFTRYNSKSAQLL